MYTLFLMACVVVFIQIIISTKGVDKKNKYLRWGLGVDCICYYSSCFTVKEHGITLVGYQEVLNGQSPIQYFVVKQKWWGKTKVYGQAVIYGDYKSPNGFHMAITNIPYGEDYRIKVVSNGNISRGKFKVMTW